MEKIFIPSKNRVNNCSFVKLLINWGVPFTIVLEPQEANKYISAYGDLDILLLPQSDQGISYARNHIKEHTENLGIKKYWMFDDDLTALYFREDARMVKGDISVLCKAESQFSQHGAAIGALDYQQIAWSATNPISINTYCEVAVFVDNSKTRGLRYRQEVNGKEDRDFVMQIIKNGGKSVRTTLYAFGAPAIGSNSGGLKDIFYDLGKEDLCCDAMVKMWGEDICQKYKKENGRVDVKIHWSRITSPQISLF